MALTEIKFLLESSADAPSCFDLRHNRFGSCLVGTFRLGAGEPIIGSGVAVSGPPLKCGAAP
jgi:hypothetical protein